jgi:hypothetical protein
MALRAAGGVVSAATVVNLVLWVDLLAPVDEVAIVADSFAEINPLGGAFVHNARSSALFLLCRLQSQSLLGWKRLLMQLLGFG